MRIRTPLRNAAVGLIGLSTLAQLAQAVHLTDDRLSKVADVMNAISSASWENGTKAQAILEYNYPSLSVFSPTPPLPLPDSLPSGDISQIIDIAKTTLSNRPATNVSVTSTNGTSLLADGAAADPASLGIAVLLANHSTGNAQQNGVGYGDAAQAELNYLLNGTPKFSNGAISHRADQAQYWSDFVYMVPPFLAYYAVLNNNQSLLQEAYTQCQLYRDGLRQSNNLWAHILQGTGTHDAGLWATGNAWAAAGMLRVWATIKWSPYAGDMGSQLNDLQSWTREILTASQQYISSNGLLHNYIDKTDTFEDSAGSALMAAAGLRLSTLNITTDHVNMSLVLLSAVSAKVNSTGYVTQVVNPYDFSKQGAESPEAQSFVVMAYSAYNEWIKMGSPGKPSDNPLGKDSGAARGVEVSVGGALVLLVSGVLGWSLF